jgi:hypothetical protein
MGLRAGSIYMEKENSKRFSMIDLALLDLNGAFELEPTSCRCVFLPKKREIVTQGSKDSNMDLAL